MGDLWSGCPFWLLHDDTPEPRASDLSGDLNCDVAVVGAGITGALIAYHLAGAGLDVVVLDGGAPGLGSTVVSTALLQYELDTPLRRLRELVGRAHADRAYRAMAHAVLRLGVIVGELPDRCGFRRRESLCLASAAADAAELRREAAARREIGLDVTYLTDDALREQLGFIRPAGILSAIGAEVDPHAFTLALLRAAGQARVFVGAGARLEAVNDDTGVLLRAAGGSVRARHAVLATGYAAQSYLDRPLATVRSTYALATAVQRSESLWPSRCLVWETARPYLYLRTTPRDEIVIGGEDEDLVAPADRDALIPAKAAVLARRLAELLPGVDTTSTCVWAGAFADTPDGLPYIDRPPHMPHVWFALGYGGNGITCSLLAAEIIRGSLTGRPHPDAALFRFDR